jgi:DNA-binding LacI/PurR family transcriptional regulator
MEILPKRTNLIRETVATLKEWINSGILKHTLPGERELKARLGIGRNTLRLALDALAQEGWVSPASHGRVRRVQQPARSPTEAPGPPDGRPVTFLSPFSPPDGETLLELEDLRMRLEEQGRRLQFITPAVFRLKDPARRLERLVDQHPSAAWLLYVVSEPMQRWFDQQGIRAFLYGTPFPGVKLPYLVSDWEAAAFHAGLQLVRQGHRVIGILEYQERFPGVLAVERGLQRALDTTSDGGRLAIFKDEMTPASVARSLEAVFSLRERPTALVCTRANQLLTCLSWLGSRGIRFPAQVSLVSLNDDTWMADCVPPVCYYRANALVIARHLGEKVMELIATGHVARQSLRLQLEYMPGASIGRAPGGS